MSIRLPFAFALALALLATAAVVATGCGSDDDDSGRPSVAATTGLLADVTEQLAGDDIEVVQVIPDSSSPHDFQLSAQDRAEIEDADLLVHNGASLEEGIPVDEIDVPQFALTDNVGELLPLEEGEEDDQGGDDPHVWMDPSRTAQALPALADALAEADPDNADAYRKRADAYADELNAVDAEVEQTLAAIPDSDRELVTSHDALGYFADRYGFTVVATPFSASGPDAEASAEAIQEVEDAIAESGVPTVFAEEDDDPEVLRLIADRAGVEIIEDLHVEAPGSAESYLEMLRRNGELIATGLAAPAQP